jgi:hypothetical protein
MTFVCDHCTELTEGAAFRVISEEGGMVVVDMIVCAPCHEQAKNLGLDTETFELSSIVICADDNGSSYLH